MYRISDAMKKAAQDFETAAIEAHMDFAKIVYESQLWGGFDKGVSIFAIDEENRSHKWSKDGELDEVV